jgi:hypothetical protein
MSASDVSWRVERDGASLHCGPLDAYVGCMPDGFDLLLERWNGQAVPNLFQVLISAGPRQPGELLEIAEVYQRGNDFVAAFARTRAQQVAPQVYWRAAHLPSFSAVKVELVLSVHTELLDSAPAWPVGSFVQSAWLFHADNLSQPRFEEITNAPRRLDQTAPEHLFVFRAGASKLSYAQMVHPSDFVAADVSFDDDQTPHLFSTIFPERLEKGVIRRGRICGWFMPAENDLETAIVLARQFVEEPLPLTA